MLRCVPLTYHDVAHIQQEGLRLGRSSTQPLLRRRPDVCMQSSAKNSKDEALHAKQQVSRSTPRTAVVSAPALVPSRPPLDVGRTSSYTASEDVQHAAEFPSVASPTASDRSAARLPTADCASTSRAYDRCTKSGRCRCSHGSACRLTPISSDANLAGPGRLSAPQAESASDGEEPPRCLMPTPLGNGPKDCSSVPCHPISVPSMLTPLGVTSNGVEDGSCGHANRAIRSCCHGSSQPLVIENSPLGAGGPGPLCRDRACDRSSGAGTEGDQDAHRVAVTGREVSDVCNAVVTAGGDGAERRGHACMRSYQAQAPVLAVSVHVSDGVRCDESRDDHALAAISTGSGPRGQIPLERQANSFIGSQAFAGSAPAPWVRADAACCTLARVATKASAEEVSDHRSGVHTRCVARMETDVGSCGSCNRHLQATWATSGTERHLEKERGQDQRKDTEMRRDAPWIQAMKATSRSWNGSGGLHGKRSG